VTEASARIVDAVSTEASSPAQQSVWNQSGRKGKGLWRKGFAERHEVTVNDIQPKQSHINRHRSVCETKIPFFRATDTTGVQCCHHVKCCAYNQEQTQ